jgi:hypothetical protein
MVGQVLSVNKPHQPPLSLQELQGQWLDAQGTDAAGLHQRVFAAGGCLGQGSGLGCRVRVWGLVSRV